MRTHILQLCSAEMSITTNPTSHTHSESNPSQGITAAHDLEYFAGKEMRLTLTGTAVTVAVAAVCMGVMITLPWEKEVTFGMERVTTYDNDPYENSNDTSILHTRETLYFPCSGERCHAWLYLPRCTPADALDINSVEDPTSGAARRLVCGSVTPPPVVIMAHGMGGTKDHKLDEIGAEIADAGYAVLLFDYRSWGGSDGQPRHALSPGAQLEDYEAAVMHIKETGGLDGKCNPDRIILWGTSYSGGHSLVTAAKMGPANISAVIAMEPFLSSAAIRERQSKRTLPVIRVLRLAAVAVSDSLRKFVGLPGAYVTMVAEEGAEGLSAGLLEPGDYKMYRESQPAKRLGGTQNLILCRIIWKSLNYRPLDSIAKIQVPTLLIAGLQDDLTPAPGIHAASKKMADATYIPLDGTHISLYNNPALVPTMIGFLKDRVPLSQGTIV